MMSVNEVGIVLLVLIGLANLTVWVLLGMILWHWRDR